MKKFIFFILTITLVSINIYADNLLRSGDDKVLPYMSFEKLNERLYSDTNKDTILGVGVDIKADDDTNFIIAFEGDIYNEERNNLSIAPAKKVGLYLNGGAITYKFKYSF